MEREQPVVKLRKDDGNTVKERDNVRTKIRA